MSTFQEVAANIRLMANNVEVNVPRLIRQVALAIDQVLIVSTPVDTGRARGNWQVSINSPKAGLVGGVPLSNKTDSIGVPGASGQFAIESAIQATQGFEGGSIYIVNNLPYIVGPGTLNDGHSKQASPGFIQAAILEGIAAVKDVSLLQKPKG